MTPERPDFPRTREEAQKRADRIRAFREELRELEASGVAVLPEEVGARIRRHHDELLESLAGRFDVDRTEAEKRLSLGMQIASLLGAVALSFAVFFFFYRIWGAIPTSGQVALLVAAPILGVLGTEIAARKESRAAEDRQYRKARNTKLRAIKKKHPCRFNRIGGRCGRSVIGSRCQYARTKAEAGCMDFVRKKGMVKV